MPQPSLIFFDAAGTLFGVRGTVGEVYGNFARRFGVEVDDRRLNQAFFESFGARDQAAFPGVPETEIPRLEFQWWEAIATDSFKRAGVFHQFTDFSTFFAQLYDYFATAEPWFVYPDVRPTLESLHSQGIPLGVLSNFDSRLYSVLEALNLAEFFDSVTLSTRVGAAKPNPPIFKAGLEKHGCSPSEAWHIGDSYRDDYQGAIAAGLRGIWLRRTP
jgi:putative hydrolase of the HAD superfamily